jgi:hypothetical protein
MASFAVGSAYAVDGVIEINQARVKAGGVTPGDTPLFPVTIDQPGSYRLTGNLDVTDATARPPGTLPENTTAILVTANGVTIDLNGFAIMGATTCSGPPVSCTPVGTGVGIDAAATTGAGAMNGVVRGMGSAGVLLGRTSQAERIRAEHNGDSGISLPVSGTDDVGASLLSNCTARLNGRTGLVAVTMINSSASLNGGSCPIPMPIPTPTRMRNTCAEVP